MIQGQFPLISESRHEYSSRFVGAYYAYRSIGAVAGQFGTMQLQILGSANPRHYHITQIEAYSAVACTINAHAYAAPFGVTPSVGRGNSREYLLSTVQHDATTVGAVSGSPWVKWRIPAGVTTPLISLPGFYGNAGSQIQIQCETANNAVDFTIYWVELPTSN